MIEVPEGIDRGRFLFEKYPKVITNFVNDRKSTYFDNDKVYGSLKKRVKTLDDIIDLNFESNEGHIAEIAMPIVRTRWRQIGAFTKKYFENEPLVTLTPMDGTPEVNAQKRQQLINRNFVTTNFRERCLDWLVDSNARYGACCAFTQYVEGYGQSGYKTVPTPGQYTPYQRIKTPKTRKNAVTYPIHILNYFCDPQKNYFNRATYEGFIDPWTMAQLRLCVNDPEMYIIENVKNVLEKHQKGSNDEFWYGGQGMAEVRDFSRSVIDVSRMWCSLPFEDNEDDDTEYYIEFIDGKIIRIHECELDLNQRPIKTSNLLNRTDVWWGNTDLEDIIPHQNLSNWTMNTQIESTMRLMDRYILTPRGRLNIADINARHNQSGVVFYDQMMGEDPSKLMYQVQQRDNSLPNFDWVNREIKQSIQESSPVVNMQNKYNEGGLNNSTLGAAQMMAGIGEVLQGDMMLGMSRQLCHIGRTSANILTVMLDDEFLFPDKEAPGGYRLHEKHEVMGEVEEDTESSMKSNDTLEFTAAVNRMTQFLNWSGTQNPALQGVNFEELVKDVLKKSLGRFADLDKYYKPPSQQPQQPVQGQPPQNPMVNAGPQPQQMGITA